MIRAPILFAHLIVTWLLLSGHYTATLVTYGVLCCVAVVALIAHLRILDREALPTHLGLRPFLYLPWLAKEIVLSNLSVARVILTPSLPIRPRLLRVSASQQTQVGQVMYANSITLTPGTITLDLRDGQLLVHALTDDSAQGLLSGEMDRRVAHLEEWGAAREQRAASTSPPTTAKRVGGDRDPARDASSSWRDRVARDSVLAATQGASSEDSGAPSRGVVS